MNDRARTGRTLLSLKSERRLDDPGSRVVEICICIDDDRILAAHLCHYTLNPKLAWLGFGCHFIDVQPNLLRSGKGDEPRFGALDHLFANFLTAAWNIVHNTLWQSTFFQNLEKLV